MASLRHPWVHLVSRELSTLAWLRALRHLDLKVIGIHEVFACYTESSRCNLLDCRTLRIAIR
ncbi:unannotated protein [freshwater metagenome]|uniref:Unannotated protein n=1 Tax=freshwater metagenome TaxID=449393 RepID=A0A6J6S1P8_9ZZZZ